MAKFRFRSGGAYGTDAYFDFQCIKHNYEIIHLSFIGHNNANSLRGIIYRLDEECLENAKPMFNLLIGYDRRMRYTTNDYVNKLKLRNMYITKYANIVIACGNIKNGEIQGGTRYGCLDAYLHDKPVLIYNQLDNKIYGYFDRVLKQTNIKEYLDLYLNDEDIIAGIGSQNITPNGKSFICKVFKYINNRT